MLETIDLGKSIGKKEFKRIYPELQDRLYNAQKASWDANVPVVILFEGWDAAGKGTSIQALTSPLDPRGFKLYPIRAARTYEKKRPWLWRFWAKLPARGEWAIFDRSWYGRVLVERMENLIPESDWRRGYRDIVDFERTLADDGEVIIKFFLHISKQEQKRRFEKLIKDPLTAWHVAPEDWEHHRRYDDWFQAYEEMFEHTETEWAPWTIVEATDRRFTQVKIFQTIIHTLEEKLGVVYEPPPELAEQQEAASTAEAESEEEEAISLQQEPLPAASMPLEDSATVELQAGPANLDGAPPMLEEPGQTQ